MVKRLATNSRGQYRSGSLYSSAVVSDAVLAFGPKNRSLGADIGEELELNFLPCIANARPQRPSGLHLTAAIYTNNIFLPLLSQSRHCWHTSGMFDVTSMHVTSPPLHSTIWTASKHAFFVANRRLV